MADDERPGEYLSDEEEARRIKEWISEHGPYVPIKGPNDPRLAEQIRSYQEVMIPHIRDLQRKHSELLRRLLSPNWRSRS
jgi:hypothetical protein